MLYKSPGLGFDKYYENRAMAAEWSDTITSYRTMIFLDHFEHFTI